jgi:D-xylose transport system ATP-binding protein
MNPSMAVEMTNITKRFPGVIACNKASLAVARGEVMALVGENGAGKSTLIKVLGGVYPRSTFEGEMSIGGKPVEFSSVADAKEAGVCIVHQELNIVPQMSVAENVFLGAEPKVGWRVDWSKLYSDTEKLLDQIGFNISARESLRNLKLAQRQLVEITKAVASNPKVLVLDEPTSALSDTEVDRLFDVIRGLKKEGIGIVYITHRMEEIFEIADKVTVMRDGETVGVREVSKVSRGEIVQMMVGRDLTQMYPKEEFKLGETVLKVEHWSVEHPQFPGRKLLDDVNLEVRTGEIVGLAGLVGAGRSELALSLFGALGVKHTGRASIKGKPLSGTSVRDSIRTGLGLIPENRKVQGLIVQFDLNRNINLASLDRKSKAGVMDECAEELESLKQMSQLAIKAPSIRSSVNTLSGGNQQKVVVGKWLAAQPDVLILDEPTRGVDVGAKVEIYKIINDLVRQGVGILMISSDLPELLGMCDRIYVMHEGRISGEFTHDEATQEAIMTCATGGEVNV